jgi:hypothetical protein
MIDGSTIRHASTCMDIALEMFEDGDDAKALEYIRKCLDDINYILRSA